MSSNYKRIIAYLTDAQVPFEEIQHPPAASAEEYSRVVGSRLPEQAKALLLRRYRSGGGKDLVLHSLPGDQRGDLQALAPGLAAKRLRFATADELKAATGCRFGELPSIGSVFGLPLSLDERLLSQRRIFFNAGRLDRSVVLDPNTLCRIEQAIVVAPAPAAEAAPPSSS